MNELTKDKIICLYEQKFIKEEYFLEFIKRPSNKRLYKALKSQYEILSQEDFNTLKVTLFDSWNNTEEVINEDEIVVLVQLVNSSGVLFKRDLGYKTKLTEYRLKNAILGLIEDNLVDYITAKSNEKYYFLNLTKIQQLIQK